MSKPIAIEGQIRDAFDSARISGSTLTLSSQLDRKIYVTVNEIIEALGGKWSKKAKCHTFDYEPQAAVQQVLETSVFELGDKNPFDYYPTPPAVGSKFAGLVTRLAWNRTSGSDKLRILEPSAGSGNLVDSVNFSWGSTGQRQVTDLQWTLIEIQPHLASGLRGKYPRATVLEGVDFMSLKPGDVEPFDIIVMNPPFSKGLDIKHVLHAFTLLRTGGALAAIMSPGWRFRNGKTAEQLHILFGTQKGKWEDLPEGSFKPSGTMVNTGILTLRR